MDVKKHVEEVQYTRKTRLCLSPTGLLVPLDIPHVVWEDITMDFIEGLLKAKGHQTILVIVDRLSKYNHFYWFTTPFYSQNGGGGFH